MTIVHGYEDGDICGRDGCKGRIINWPSEDCRCHLSPPCESCVNAGTGCKTCSWQSAYESVMNDHVVNVNPKTGIYKDFGLRQLDPTRLDYHSKPHTHFSMVKEGVYPESMTREQVEQEVRGTFGGRFAWFGDGKFKYISYTD